MEIGMIINNGKIFTMVDNIIECGAIRINKGKIAQIYDKQINCFDIKDKIIDETGL